MLATLFGGMHRFALFFSSAIFVMIFSPLSCFFTFSYAIQVLYEVMGVVLQILLHVSALAGGS